VIWNLFFKPDPETAQQLDRLEALLKHQHEHLVQILKRITSMALDVSEERAAITELATAVANAVGELQTAAQAIKDNATDQAAVHDFATQIHDLAGNLNTAVAAISTPATAPQPEPAPEPAPAEQPVA
jgi:predicted  nucleic acid-binding Zn-ribbon protein